jgi:magnesium transporter
MFTIITTPMTLIASWYGMNFKGMPEIDQPHGYVFAIVLTLITTGLTFIYFRQKRWL